ncbi:MAG: hypothetical protein RMK50_07265, partial [Nitrososphaerota archaeon]|nr:hypothetical protein [Candidatus Bathyarchaeota archaeon]MDW8194598.1 hypothetical protein [Nitrososphaerota archaeon]
MTVEDIIEILGSTVKHDDQNKAITFLVMLLNYTDEDQINIGFLAESSSGKSYIPLEVAQYFPQEDILTLGYATPRCFFHEHGVLMYKEGIPVNPDMKPTKDKVKEDLEFEKGEYTKEDVEAEYKRQMRRWRELLKGSYYLVDLHQKILIFLDMPHDELLQRLRSILSHDQKEIASLITDKKDKGGLRTKKVVIKGYPTVIFCSAKFNMDDQEKTRLLLLSPEVSQEKLRESIALKIEKESNREAFKKRLMEDPKRRMLIERVRRIKEAKIGNIIIPEEFRSFIYQQFLEDHKFLAPRHQRDISRLLALIKAHALLNFMHRKRVDNSIIVEKEDVEVGFKLYYSIAEANERGLPPEIYAIYQKITPYIQEEGITINDFQKAYFKEFHKPIGSKRTSEILNILASCGLLIEDYDPNDKRRKRYRLPEKILPPTEGEYISIPEKILPPTEG